MFANPNHPPLYTGVLHARFRATPKLVYQLSSATSYSSFKYPFLRTMRRTNESVLQTVDDALLPIYLTIRLIEETLADEQIPYLIFTNWRVLATPHSVADAFPKPASPERVKRTFDTRMSHEIIGSRDESSTL